MGRERIDFKRGIVLESIFVILGVVAIIFFFRNNFLLTGTFVVLALVLLKISHKKGDFYFYISGAIIGSLIEILAVKAEVWQYANPTFLGIPVWLPFGWGLSGLLIVRIGYTLSEINGGRR